MRLGTWLAGLAFLACATPATATADSGTFSNPGPIAINDATGASAPYTPGAGSPYPATVGVSGLTGPVTDVNVTLAHVGHFNPDDLDVMLVGPQGQRIVVLSDSGENFPLSGADLTFDDQAAGPAPDAMGMSSGSYRPTNHFGGLGEPPDGNDPFLSPAPGPPRASTLAEAFNGTDPNGTWSLFVVDDKPGDTGAIGEGFSVQVTTGTTPPPSPAATRAEFQPEAQSGAQRLHRLVTLDASRSIIGDPRAARTTWDVNSDGKPEGNCSGLQPQATVHVATTAKSLPVTLTIREPTGITSVARQTVAVPFRSPGPRRAQTSQSRGLVTQLNRLDNQLKHEGNAFSLVCGPPPGKPIGADITDNGGPRIGCAKSLQTGLIDAIGCLDRVNGPLGIPIAERRLVAKVVDTTVQQALGRASGAAHAAAAFAPVPKAFASNPYGRVDAPLPQVSSKIADIVAELDPHVSKDPVRINGVDFLPKPGAAVVVWGMQNLVASSNAVVKVGPATLHSGALVWRLPDPKRNHLGDFNLSGSLRSALGGLDADGRVGLDFGRFSSELTVNARLPAPLTDDASGPVTGATTLKLDNPHGLDAGGATLDLKSGRVGGVEIVGNRLGFNPAERAWRGDVRVYVPPNAFPTGQLSIRNGSLEYFRLRSGPFDAGGGTAFDGLDLADRRGGGFRLAGPAAGRSPLVLPFLGSTCPVVQAAGEGSLTGARNTGRMEISGGPTSILCIGVPDGHFVTTENGLTEATGTLRADLVKGKIFVEMDLRGRVAEGHFQANGGARACINVLVDVCKGADAVVSDTGMGICTDVGLSGPFKFVSVRVGGGVRFRPPLGQKVFAASCDLKPFSSFAMARTAAGERRVRFPAGLKAAYIEIEGRGGAPSITMAGPHGRRVVTPPGGHADGKQGYVLDRNGDGITYVLLGRPAGSWVISEDAGSPPIAAVRSASTLPEPAVTASVRGRGAQRRLVYRVKPLRGQRVRFAEVGTRAFHQLGSARGSRGTLRFSPAPGGRGKRKIVATIEQGGLPREALTVATYKAAPAGPRRPRSVRLHRKGARVAVSWSRVRAASSYRVSVKLSDGRRDVLSLRGTQATLGHVPPSGQGTVTVVAVGSKHQAGAGRTARLKAKPRPRPRAKRVHRKKHG